MQASKTDEIEVWKILGTTAPGALLQVGIIQRVLSIYVFILYPLLVPSFPERSKLPLGTEISVRIAITHVVFSANKTPEGNLYAFVGNHWPGVCDITPRRSQDI